MSNWNLPTKVFRLTTKKIIMPRTPYPHLNIHFKVSFHGMEFENESNFQSVQGLKTRLCENVENGKGQVKYDNLVLRRAYQPNSLLAKWCLEGINNPETNSIDFTVSLLNAQQQPISSWNIKNARPVAWGIDDLHAQDSKILMETIELAYKSFHTSHGN